MGDGGTGGDEGRTQGAAVGGVLVGPRHVEHPAGAGAAGVHHEDVEPTQPGGRVVHDALRLAILRNVARDRDRVRQSRRDVGGGVGSPADDRHARTLGGE